MSQENTNEQSLPQEIKITEEMAEQAKTILKNSLDLFAEQTHQLASDIAKFNERQKQAQERIRRGGYRTSGRIV